VRVVFNLLDASVGGGQRVAAGIAQSLVDRSHDVGVAVPAAGPALEWFEALGARVHIVDLQSLRRPRGVAAAAEAFRDYDVVYSHTSVPGEILAIAAARRAGRPHVAHRHVYPHFSPLWPVAAVQRGLYARAAHRSRMIAVAEHVARAAAVAGVPLDRIEVIPNGVALPVDPPEPRQSPPVRFGVLARLDTQKGIDLFVSAAAASGLNPSEATFDVGTPEPVNDSQRELLERARAAGVGIDSPAEGGAFLSRLDVVVIPSRNFEGLPLTLLEALALRKAILATDIPGIHEALAGTGAGVLVPPEDVTALAGAIRSLACDPIERLRLATRARALADERYSLSDTHDRVAHVLRRAASDG
jgi:glycosyltransferase involved in cell wall biosynthesis